MQIYQALKFKDLFKIKDCSILNVILASFNLPIISKLTSAPHRVGFRPNLSPSLPPMGEPRRRPSIINVLKNSLLLLPDSQTWKIV